MEESACAICMQPKTNPYALEECGHEFCSGCIIKWFREKRCCPLCRDTPVVTYTRIDAMERKKTIVRRAARKSASPQLKQAVQRLRELKAETLRTRSAYTQLERQHRDVLKQVRKARGLYWKTNRKTRIYERELGYKQFPRDEPLLPPRVTTVVDHSFQR